jgi:hypothetical protein
LTDHGVRSAPPQLPGAAEVTRKRTLRHYAEALVWWHAEQEALCWQIWTRLPRPTAWPCLRDWLVTLASRGLPWGAAWGG